MSSEKMVVAGKVAGEDGVAGKVVGEDGRSSGRQLHFTPTRTTGLIRILILPRFPFSNSQSSFRKSFRNTCGNKMKKRLTLEEGLDILKEGITKAMRILDGYPTSALFTCEEYMKFYEYPFGANGSGSLISHPFSANKVQCEEIDFLFLDDLPSTSSDVFLSFTRASCVYDMCVQHPPYEYCAELYEIFKKALEESITSRVMPALKDKTHIYLLYELWSMWTKYKVMAKCLGGFFLYLDRHFVEDRKAVSLSDLSICCFHDLVCSELYPKISEAAISLINQDRDDNSVCRDLLKNVSTFFVEIGMGKMHYYENFEMAVITSTANYYNRLVPEWLLRYSSADYILKAECCLSQEKERASQFLHQTSVEKLLLVVHEQLLGETASKVLEKQRAECGDGSVSYQSITISGSSVVRKMPFTPFVRKHLFGDLNVIALVPSKGTLPFCGC
ncbi:hypothetical protein OSB04_016594 [Centaurea solstitialis]|uniref:Cullin N-terminal domain-containing protein n=1 Tax=Centaurea solstitialis TaxID=347529 RepID=A0AA38T2X0_9ASTR|nr:hypothetical protein OSB04_016594 [Centaurea solstitialis]